MRKNAINAEGISEPFSAVEVPAESSSKGSRFAMNWRALSDFATPNPHLGFILEELPAGKQSNIQHYHMLEEEHVYVLDGSVTVRLGDRSHVMQAGDYVCFPAGQKAGHCLVNHTDSVCRYILVGERNPHDVCVYTETGRVGIRLIGEGYSKARVMDYWEGVETD